MSRLTNKGNRSKDDDRVKMYSTKLYKNTYDLIKDLTKAGNTIYDKGYSERQLLEDALELYKKAHPELCEIVRKIHQAEEKVADVY